VYTYLAELERGGHIDRDNGSVTVLRQVD